MDNESRKWLKNHFFFCCETAQKYSGTTKFLIPGTDGNERRLIRSFKSDTLEYVLVGVAASEEEAPVEGEERRRCMAACKDGSDGPGWALTTPQRAPLIMARGHKWR